ncbi:MAG: HAD family phosphatase [Anaerolineae bacterium]
MSPLRAVLFDMDGVLVQTEPLKAEAHAAATRYFGGEVAPAFYATKMGRAVEEIGRAFLAAGEVNGDMARYLPLSDQAYHRLVETQLAPTPGVTEFLQQLKQDGWRLGLVTSDYAPMMRYVVERAGLAQFFDTTISRDDVTRIKPAPDGYLAALARLEVAANTAVVVEDSESGLQAAVGAGLPVLALRHSFNTHHNFSLAAQIVDSFLDPRALIQAIETILPQK